MASSPGFEGGILTGVPTQPRKSGGLLEMLQQLFSGGEQPQSALMSQEQLAATGNTAMRPALAPEAQAPSPWKKLMAPNVALPAAAALLGNRGNAGNFGAALGAIGPGLERNQTIDYLRKNDPEIAKMVDSGLPVRDAFDLHLEQRKAQLSNVNKAPSIETFYDEATGLPYKAQWGLNGWERVGGAKAGEGFEVELGDGTTVRSGAFGNQDRKNMANRISEGQESSAAASQLKQTVKLLREANANIGYSGVGSGIYGALDDTAEQFGFGDKMPGSAGARATMRKGGVDAALAMVGKTKGAISNAEMGLFMAAAPGMANTPQANEALFDAMEAIADRDIERQDQMERWRAENGTLDGFEKAWGDYITANPVIVSDGKGGITRAGMAPGGQQLQPGQSRDLGNGVQLRRTR